MAVDMFAKEDGLVSLSGVMSFELSTSGTIKVGDVVYVKTHVLQGLPKIDLAVANKIPLGVVVDLGKGAGATGTFVSVALCGSAYIVKVVAETVVTAGNLCKTAAAAKVQATQTEAVCAEEHKEIVGLALQTSATDGDEFLVLLS